MLNQVWIGLIPDCGCQKRIAEEVIQVRLSFWFPLDIAVSPIFLIQTCPAFTDITKWLCRFLSKYIVIHIFFLESHIPYVRHELFQPFLFIFLLIVYRKLYNCLKEKSLTQFLRDNENILHICKWSIAFKASGKFI